MKKYLNTTHKRLHIPVLVIYLHGAPVTNSQHLVLHFSRHVLMYSLGILEKAGLDNIFTCAEPKQYHLLQKTICFAATSLTSFM